MEMKIPYSHNDIVMFPDTYTETVDVGIGFVPVAQEGNNIIMRVMKWGRGFRLQFMYDTDYSEHFLRAGYKKYKTKGDKKNYISLKEYIDYFGNFDNLEYVGEYDPITKDVKWEKEDET